MTEELKKDQQESEQTEELKPEEAQAEESAEKSGSDVQPEEAASEKNEPAETQEDEDLKTQFLRLSADFQNFRRRSEAEKADIYAYANEKIVVQILDVIDNFERAMQTAPSDDKFAEGMGLILKQLTDVLDKNNVKEIEALDKAFDPSFHNAVMTETVEGKEAGIVTKVLQKGYLLNSKVIRPAMVAVSQ